MVRLCGQPPGTVWIAGLAAGLFGPRRAMVGAATLGIPGINAVAHIAPAIRTMTYNPGLLTSVVLFVPLCVWTFRVLVRSGLLTRARVAVAMVSGVVLHAVLMGSLIGFMHGLYPEPVLVLVQIANGFVPIGTGLALRPLPTRA